MKVRWLCRAILVGIGLVIICPGALSLQPREKDDLTREWAEFRRAQIESVSYDVHLTFQENAATFDGSAKLKVALNTTAAPLSIDWKGKSIRDVAVNGKKIYNFVRHDGSLEIPAEHLAGEPMTITIDFTGLYTRSRDGLCHYIDPVDGREYVYTNLEPYAAHYVFPCFNQPDLKGPFTLAITAPESWKAIGNTKVASTSSDGNARTTTFETTPPLSTYLYFVGAGDYRVWHDEHKGLFLALFARASLAEYFDPERLFAETKAGLDYFTEYFRTPYPFKKYDHIFVPEFGPGAMENPGAVTMNERMIFRGTPTGKNFRSRNNVLLHEMAHMWFGDLVTMAWWNDLWLNESFATFSAYQAQDAIGAYGPIWPGFFDTKGWAYHQDQLSTTHPVKVPVPTAQQAIANFDGITYAKGAAALKQLWFSVGAEAYRDGVANYFAKYAWKNATSAEFMAMVAAETKAEFDLSTWTRRWIETEGLASITVDYTCADGKISEFRILQESVNTPALSPHRTKIALYYFDDAGKLVPQKVAPVQFENSEKRLAVFEGERCPDFVYANHDDMDYGLYFLDGRSYETLFDHIPAVADPFARRMVWGTLSGMVRHQKLTASAFVDVLLENLPRENDPGMVEYLLDQYATTFIRYFPPEKALEVAPRFEDLLWRRFESAPHDSDLRLFWLDAYITAASRPGQIARLRSLLDMGAGRSGLDQPRRWETIRAMASLGAPDVEALVEAELLRDPTDQGRRFAFSIRGAVPAMDVKRARWKALKDPDLSLTLLRAGAANFHDPLHPELTEPFVDDWFDYVLSRDWEAEQHKISVWFGSLMPTLYRPAFLARSRSALATAELSERARRAWQESNDNLERVILIRAHDIATPATSGESSLEN